MWSGYSINKIDGTITIKMAFDKHTLRVHGIEPYSDDIYKTVAKAGYEVSKEGAYEEAPKYRE